MAEITMQEMQRQLHNYAMEEMRNRGIEEAAKLLERRPGTGSTLQYHFREAAADVRSLKRDPRLQMTDWWAHEKEKSEGSGQSPAPSGETAGDAR